MLERHRRGRGFPLWPRVPLGGSLGAGCFWFLMSSVTLPGSSACAVQLSPACGQLASCRSRLGGACVARTPCPGCCCWRPPLSPMGGSWPSNCGNPAKFCTVQWMPPHLLFEVQSPFQCVCVWVLSHSSRVPWRALSLSLQSLSHPRS